MQNEHIWQNSTSFQIKTLKLRIRGDYLYIIKAINEKAIANILLSGEKLILLLKSGKKAKIPILFTFIYHITGSPSKSNKQEKGIQIGKEKVKLSPLADDVILYVKYC